MKKFVNCTLITLVLCILAISSRVYATSLPEIKTDGFDIGQGCIIIKDYEVDDKYWEVSQRYGEELTYYRYNKKTQDNKDSIIEITSRCGGTYISSVIADIGADNEVCLKIGNKNGIPFGLGPEKIDAYPLNIMSGIAKIEFVNRVYLSSTIYNTTDYLTPINVESDAEVHLSGNGLLYVDTYLDTKAIDGAGKLVISSGNYVFKSNDEKVIGIANEKFIINGGNIKICDGFGNTNTNGLVPKNADGKDLHLVEITIDKLTENTLVDDININSNMFTYDTDNIKTITQGLGDERVEKIYLWLPEQDCITEITIGEDTYKGTLTYDENANKETGVFKKIIEEKSAFDLENGSVYIDNYYLNNNEVEGDHWLIKQKNQDAEQYYLSPKEDSITISGGNADERVSNRIIVDAQADDNCPLKLIFEDIDLASEEIPFQVNSNASIEIELKGQNEFRQAIYDLEFSESAGILAKEADIKFVGDGSLKMYITNYRPENKDMSLYGIYANSLKIEGCEVAAYASEQNKEACGIRCQEDIIVTNAELEASAHYTHEGYGIRANKLEINSSRVIAFSYYADIATTGLYVNELLVNGGELHVHAGDLRLGKCYGIVSSETIHIKEGMVQIHCGKPNPDADPYYDDTEDEENTNSTIVGLLVPEGSLIIDGGDIGCSIGGNENDLVFGFIAKVVDYNAKKPNAFRIDKLLENDNTCAFTSVAFACGSRFGEEVSLPTDDPQEDELVSYIAPKVLGEYTLPTEPNYSVGEESVFYAIEKDGEIAQELFFDYNSSGEDPGPNPGEDPTPPSTHSSRSSKRKQKADILVNGEKQSAGDLKESKQNGQKVAVVTVDRNKLSQVLETEGERAQIVIPVMRNADVSKGSLDGQMVKDMEHQKATIEIQTNTALYSIPASEIDIDHLAELFGEDIALEEIDVKIVIAKTSNQTVKVVEEAANEGEFSIMVPAVDFTITCTYNGQTINVGKFYSYVSRKVAIPESVNPEKITTGIVVHQDGSTHHVPTKVVIIDGMYFVEINSLTNSTYTVIYHPIEFSDVNKHWAKDSINNMASRMVVNGIGENNYAPDRNITRAEVAKIVVTALGLEEGVGEVDFSDVYESDWFSGYVQTAASYGLINGYDDGNFRPQEEITREEVMAIIHRAMKITGLENGLSEEDSSKLLVEYEDAENVANYAKESIATCLKSGIINGRNTTTLAPKSNITRAEVAVIMERLLHQSDLI